MSKSKAILSKMSERSAVTGKAYFTSEYATFDVYNLDKVTIPFDPLEKKAFKAAIATGDKSLIDKVFKLDSRMKNDSDKEYSIRMQELAEAIQHLIESVALKFTNEYNQKMEQAYKDLGVF